MKLSEYCVLVKTYVDNSLEMIAKEGYIIGGNNKEYDCAVEFLDDAVVDIIDYVMKCDIEKDINFSEAFVEAGIVHHYLKHTPVLSKVVYTNPLKGIFK